jgi:hypothetical protein
LLRLLEFADGDSYIPGGVLNVTRGSDRVPSLLYHAQILALALPVGQLPDPQCHASVIKSRVACVWLNLNAH